MHNRLYFRRQFLLANSVITDLKDWQHQQLNDIHLFAHPDLEITGKVGPANLVLLIGFIFDPTNPAKTNKEIVADIMSRVSTFSDLITIIKPYAGCYGLIYRDKNTFAILNDPLGLREIYYCTQPNQLICGSQPNLIDTFSEPRLGFTNDKSILDFYQQDMKLVRSGRLWVGDETCYVNVRHLMPNHYLDIGSLKVKRYWPNKKLEEIDLDTAVEQSCEYLKGVLKAVTSRYEVMMAVTSGIDSRSLLAASREIRDQIYYFINKNHLSMTRVETCVFPEIYSKK